MTAISESRFSSPLRSQNMLTTHYFTISSTPPFASLERCELLSPDRNGFPATPNSPSLPWSSPESGNDLSRRGRPKAAMITTLINHGSANDSTIRCSTCSRVFPREKSLAAHMRTHTGERPYVCDYPNCTKAFCQSGQLKTHQRLHSGEKPFVCSAKNCNIRFTHANRHCPDHPNVALLRDEDNMPMPSYDESSTAPLVREWLNKYFLTRQERTPYKQRLTLQNSATKRSLFSSPESLSEQENTDPLVSPTPKIKNRKQLIFSSLAYEEEEKKNNCVSENDIARNISLELPSSKSMNDNDDTLKGALALLQLAKAVN